MDTLYLSLIHTPWWAYLFFIYFLKYGISALSPSTYSIYRLAFVPALFIFCSTYRFIFSSLSASNTLTLWALGLAAGLVIARFNIASDHIQVDGKARTLTVPGSPYTITHTLLAYQLTIAPEVVHHFAFNVILLTTAGLFTGLSGGRSLCLGYGYYNKNRLKS